FLAQFFNLRFSQFPGQGLALALGFGLLPSILSLLPSNFGLLPSNFGLLPSNFGLLPSNFGLLPGRFGKRILFSSRHQVLSATRIIQSQPLAISFQVQP